MGRHMRKRTPREELSAAFDAFLSGPVLQSVVAILYSIIVLPFLATFLLQASLVWLAVAVVAHIVFLWPIAALFRRAHATDTTWQWYLKVLALTLACSAAMSVVALF
jgi:uncharacterized membrane protein YhaH (DUF805 family)